MTGEGYEHLTPDAQTHVHYVSAQYMLHAISAYMLPVLYGLLGASFYVLRQLPRDIENLTFSMNSHIEYSLRIAQGPLAGIMAGYFFITSPIDLHSYTDRQSVMQSLADVSSNVVDFSPLAVAFLAGYSVELIFYVIERITGAITSAPTPVRARPADGAAAKDTPATPAPVKKADPPQERRAGTRAEKG